MSERMVEKKGRQRTREGRKRPNDARSATFVDRDCALTCLSQLRGRRSKSPAKSLQRGDSRATSFSASASNVGHSVKQAPMSPTHRHLEARRYSMVRQIHYSS